MMKIPLILAISSTLSFAGTPTRARALSKAYDQAEQAWVHEVRTAKDDEAQNAAWLRRPDPLAAGRTVWEEIRGNLADAWTLEYASWLLINTPEAVVGQATVGQPGSQGSPAQKIRDAVEKYHIQSPKVGPYCIAITHVEDPHALKLLQVIEKENPDPGVKGAAALGQVILHRRLGDEKHGMFHRQENLKEAILAPDLVVGKTTTREIIKDEIFRMSHLTTGTRAPDFRGVDITRKISSLREFEGKVVILFFWHSLMPSHEESLALMSRYQQEFEGQNIVILGINMDNPLTLRKMTADGTVNWRNFSDSSQTISDIYRIEHWPYLYVLDQKQIIRYAGAPGAFVKITAEELLRKPPQEAPPAALEDDGQ